MIPVAILLATALLSASPDAAAPVRLDPPLSSTLRASTLHEPAAWNEATPRPASWRQGVSNLSTMGLYVGATRVGSRLGIEGSFKVMRLESAYAYDLVAHVYNTQQLAEIMAGMYRWSGTEPARARSLGAWLAAFGSLTYMEFVNGFMPGVRFDPWDPVANAVGAWLATGGHDLARQHAWMRRFTLEFGYKSLARAFGPAQSSGTLGNWWHDYPNGRFGLGVGVGPAENPWLHVFGTYEITSLEWQNLRNQFGIGVELQPQRWLRPWLERVPGGRSLLSGYEWLNRRVLMPGVYFQLWTFDVGPFSDREPFQE